MKNLRQELIEFTKWISCGVILVKEDSELVDEYLNSIHSSGSNEAQAVRQNEQTQEFCEECNKRYKSPKYDPCCSYFCWQDKFNS